MSVKRSAFAALGWVVWKLLAVFGVKYAQRKLTEDDQRKQ